MSNAEQLCGKRYERHADRRAYRWGSMGSEIADDVLVAPDGRWLGGYVPACFRRHPFRLVPKQGTDQTVLCVDTDSGLVVEGDAAGEDFFDREATSRRR